MAIVNYDYPFNPTCSKPLVSGKRLLDRWSVYFYYFHKGVRKQYKVSAGLNNKEDSLADRKGKAAIVQKSLIEKLATRELDTETGYFRKSASEGTMLSDLIKEYLETTRNLVVSHTYANYKTIFKSFLEYTISL